VQETVRRPIVVSAILLIVGLGLGCVQVAAMQDFNDALRAYDGRRYDAAAKLFGRAAERTDNPLLHYNAAIASWRHGQGSESGYSQALQDVENVLKRADLDDSHRAYLLYVAGDLLISVGDETRARQMFQTASDVGAENSPYLPALHRLVSLEFDASAVDANKTRLLLVVPV
jgi:tetratricopeptide (TPR) repeat protein